MCLAIPARVLEIVDDAMAIVDVGGIKKHISLSLVEGVTINDYVIIHVGFALTKLDTIEAEKTLAILRDLK